VHDWVRQASHLDAPEEDGSPDDPPSPKHKGHQHRLVHGHAIREADAEVALHVNIPGQRPKGGWLPPNKGKHFDEFDDASEASGHVSSMPDKHTDAASSGAASSCVGSMSESGGSGMDASEVAGNAGHEEELAVDTR